MKKRILTPPVPMLECAGGARHPARIELTDENDDRTRVIARCVFCRREYVLTCAKRLDAMGVDAWGPPGVWWQSEAHDVAPGDHVAGVTREGNPVLRMGASNPMKHDPETIPCETCGTPTTMLDTKRCNDCREVETRIVAYVKRGGEKAYMVLHNALTTAFPANEAREWYLKGTSK